MSRISGYSSARPMALTSWRGGPAAYRALTSRCWGAGIRVLDGHGGWGSGREGRMAGASRCQPPPLAQRATSWRKSARRWRRCRWSRRPRRSGTASSRCSPPRTLQASNRPHSIQLWPTWKQSPRSWMAPARKRPLVILVNFSSESDVSTTQEKGASFRQRLFRISRGVPVTATAHGCQPPQQ